MSRDWNSDYELELNRVAKKLGPWAEPTTSKT